MKTMKSFFLFLLLALCFSSCSDGDGPEPGMIWDIAPYNILITVADAEGNDLLDPEAENNLVGNVITATFEGKTYEMEVDTNSVAGSVSGRAILPVFHGLVLHKQTDGPYMLTFGEFAGDTNLDATDVTIDWGEGLPQDVITVSHRFWWKNHEPQQETTVLLNGVKTDNKVHIIK